MNKDAKAKYERSMRGYLEARVSRAQLLAASAAGLATAFLPGIARADIGTGRAAFQEFPFFPSVPGTYTTETMTEIFNVLTTVEHVPVTVLSNVVPNAGVIGLDSLLVAQVKAILAEESYHVKWLEGLGGVSQVSSYTIPPAVFQDYNTLFGAVYAFDTLLQAAYNTAVREFAELGQPRVAKWMAQVGGVEAEHRAMARLALAQKGASADWPPANKTFETDHFVYTRDFVTLLQGIGLIGGSSPAKDYPGIAAALSIAGDMATGVQQRTPNDASVSTGPSNNHTGERGATPS